MVIAFVDADANNRFVIENVPVGEYSITYRDRNAGVTHKARAEVTAEDQIVSVTLAPGSNGGTIQGQIVGPQLPEPQKLLDHYLTPNVYSPSAIPLTDDGYFFEHSYSGRVWQDDNGIFYEMTDLPPGPYALMFTGSYSQRTWDWYPVINVPPGTDVQQDVILRKDREILVRLQVPVGFPTVGGWTMVLPGGTEIPYGALGGGANDRQGLPRPLPFALPPGAYTIQAYFDDYEPISRPLVIEPGEETIEVVINHPDFPDYEPPSDTTD